MFSNVARANSTLGRALQLILLNLGGARPDGIDMSALGNPGKFSYCIAENEEENPWEPLHVEHGTRARAERGDAVRGRAAARSERAQCAHRRGVLKAITLRARHGLELSRVHGLRGAGGAVARSTSKTIHRDGFSKQNVRDFLFENTGIPVRCYDGEPGEGVSAARHCTKRSRSTASRAIRNFARRSRSRSSWPAERPGNFRR